MDQLIQQTMPLQADAHAKTEPGTINDLEHSDHLGPDSDESIVDAHTQSGVQNIEAVTVA
ncbi:MAG: hypothetical protein M1836_006821 [Candelina mexicana]|nr:MAG: hypothetical protein M1836_006821 [Candelina mexicana]